TLSEPTLPPTLKPTLADCSAASVPSSSTLGSHCAATPCTTLTRSSCLEAARLRSASCARFSASPACALVAAATPLPVQATRPPTIAKPTTIPARGALTRSGCCVDSEPRPTTLESVISSFFSLANPKPRCGRRGSRLALRRVFQRVSVYRVRAWPEPPG